MRRGECEVEKVVYAGDIVFYKAAEFEAEVYGPCDVDDGCCCLGDLVV